MKKGVKIILIMAIVFILIVTLYFMFKPRVMRNIMNPDYSTNQVCYKESDCGGNKQAFCYFDKNESGNLSGKCGLHGGCQDILKEDGNLSMVCVD